MKKIVHIVAVIFLLALVACQDKPAAEVAGATAVTTEAATDTAVPPTNTAEPTDVPTEVPTETAVPTATESPTASSTDIPEPTATDTATPTEESPTETPTSVPTATNTVMPPTATTAAPPAAAPPPAPAPAGPNLLANPGFEFGTENWAQPGGKSVLTADAVPQFVHSGQQSILFPVGYGAPRMSQRITTNITNGTTYRAGAWFKVWSSSEDDRNVSVNPADVFGRICINTNGDDETTLPTTVCSGWVRPLDVWQYISVDAVATNTQITVILQVTLNSPNGAVHIQPIWDDVNLGTAPSAATATPSAAGPVRPNPVAFDATALRDSMNGVRSVIEQAGGLLDRLYNGDSQTCQEYQGYYDDAIRSATYSGVPDDWAGIYNDYIFAVENFLATNESINALCDDGGGVISALNYGAARQGINNSLDRLIPAIEAANAKLGG